MLAKVKETVKKIKNTLMQIEVLVLLQKSFSSLVAFVNIVT